MESMDNAATEDWRDIADFPEYEVSASGLVRRRPRSANWRIARPLKPAVSHGYEFVTLRRDGRSYTKRVHVLVCTTFNGDRPSPRHQVAHNNGIKADNRAVNLRWATAEENQADRLAHGTDIRGEDVRGAKVTAVDVPKIRSLLEQHVPCGVIASAWNVDATTIHYIKQNKTWRHV